MGQHGVSPDVVTCCSLMTAFEMGGMWQLSLEMLIQMCAGHEALQHIARNLQQVGLNIVR